MSNDQYYTYSEPYISNIEDGKSISNKDKISYSWVEYSIYHIASNASKK